MRITFTLFLLASTLSASPVVKTFFDKDFGLFEIVPTWNSVILNPALPLPPGTSGQAESQFGGKPTEGEISAVFRNIEISLPQSAPGTTVGLVIGQINNTFTWDPLVDGAIAQMEFSFDLRAIQSSGFAVSAGIVGAFSRPVLRQDGIVYRASTSILQIQPPGNGAWTGTPASFVFASLADWTRNGAAPDLTATGAPIQFGFEAALFGECPSTATANCSSSFSRSGVDNFLVRVTGLDSQEPQDPSAIPEPASLLLLSAGILGIALVRRHHGHSS